MEHTGLVINNLKKYFPVIGGFPPRVNNWIKAVDGVTFKLEKGETIGIVGESGCGKSTLVNTVLRLIEPTSGEVFIDGQNIFLLKKRELSKLRQKMQIVFQDPFWSLNPRWLVKEIVGEPLRVYFHYSERNFVSKVGELLEMVGISRTGINKYPHEFSGGERQRIAIARALALEPNYVILDEPTSSIDVFSQERILKLLQDLKKEFDLTYILISHDLSVVKTMADRIAIMYLGKVVEYGDADSVFSNPAHPYSDALFKAIPNESIDNIDALFALEGEVPSAINIPKGCRFHTRCPLARDICRVEDPKPQDVGKDHQASCLLLGRKKEKAV